MKRRDLIRRGALALLAVLALVATSAAEASVSRDSSFKVDAFAALPQLTSKPIADAVRVIERTNSGCVALCELAASIDSDPLGYGVRPRPFDGWVTPFGRQYFYANDNPTFYVDLTGHAGSDNQARHFGTYRGDPLKPMDVSNAAALSLGAIEATAETGVELGVGTLFGISHLARSVVRGEMSRFLIDTYDSAHEFVSTFWARAERAAEASAQASARGDYYEAGRLPTREIVAPTVLAIVTIVETGRAGVGFALERGRPLTQPIRTRSPANFMAEAERRTQAQKARFGNVEAYASAEAPTGGMTVAEAEAIAASKGGATFGEAGSTKYRDTFFEANPDLEGKVVVHHAVEQQSLRRFPHAVSESEIHSLENLRGIPKAVNPDVHLSKIRKEWNQFYRENASPTREQLLAKATEIDRKYGAQFTPPVKRE